MEDRLLAARRSASPRRAAARTRRPCSFSTGSEPGQPEADRADVACSARRRTRSGSRRTAWSAVASSTCTSSPITASYVRHRGQDSSIMTRLPRRHRPIRTRLPRPSAPSSQRRDARVRARGRGRRSRCCSSTATRRRSASGGATSMPLADAGFEVIAPDLRGHGDSTSRPTASTTSPRSRMDLYTLVHDVLGHERCVVAGGDVGGVGALRPRLRYPGFVTQAVLLQHRLADPADRAIEAAGIPPDDDRGAALDGRLLHAARATDPTALLAELDTPERRRAWTWPTCTATGSGPRPAHFTADDVDFMTEPYADADKLRASWGVLRELDRQPGDERRARASSSRTRCPALVLYGPEDHVVPPLVPGPVHASLHRAASARSSSPDAGHFLQWEAADMLQPRARALLPLHVDGHGASPSIARATRNITGSPSAGASTCTPTGRPPAPVPNGTLIAGWPARFVGIVQTSRQVHRQRVGGLRAELERGRRRRRREQHVERLVGAVEVADDQRADPLRLAVVRVVVAGRERVRAEHDPALHLGAEPGVARARAFIVGDVGAVDAQAVAHAVVAGEVARRLRRRDQVVGRQPVRRSSAPTPARPSRPRFSSASRRLLDRGLRPRAGCPRRR